MAGSGIRMKRERHSCGGGRVVRISSIEIGEFGSDAEFGDVFVSF